MKSYPPPSNRPFTSLQADITFGLQWFLNECLQMNLPFFKTCRRILHLGLKPTGQGLSVSDEWLRIDLQMSSSAELVVLDAVDEETLCRLLKRDSSCIKQVLKNNPNSKRIISLFIDSFFDANLLSLLTGSAELDFIGDQLSRLSILELQKIPFSDLSVFSSSLLLNTLIEMGPSYPEHDAVKSFTEQFLISNASFDVSFCTLLSSFMVAYADDHTAELDSHFLTFVKIMFVASDALKSKIALCRGIAANIKNVDSGLVALLQQNLFQAQNNKLKWNILVALKAAVSIHDLDFPVLKAGWLQCLEELDNFKVALKYTQLLSNLATFNEENLISSKQDFELIWNANSRLKSLSSFPDESVAECAEKLSNLLQDLLGSSDWLKGGF